MLAVSSNSTTTDAFEKTDQINSSMTTSLSSTTTKCSILPVLPNSSSPMMARMLSSASSYSTSSSSSAFSSGCTSSTETSLAAAPSDGAFRDYNATTTSTNSVTPGSEQGKGPQALPTAELAVAEGGSGRLPAAKRVFVKCKWKDCGLDVEDLYLLDHLKVIIVF